MTPTALDTRRLRTAMGHFATGVAVVTAVVDGVPVGMTVQSLVSVSLDPPLLLFCPSRSSSSWQRMARADGFAVNILHAEQKPHCLSFARPGGDKFAGVRWRPGAGGAPILEDVLAFAECRLHAVHDAGDHHLVLGLIDRVELTPAGSREPLLFYRGEFASVRPPAPDSCA